MDNLINTVDDWNLLINDLLPQQMKNTDIQKILDCLNNSQSNDLQSAIIDILDKYWIDTSIGFQLDIIARLVGITRDGRNDASLRTLIGIKIDINHGTGTREDIILAITKLYNATQVDIKYDFPAGIQIAQDGDIGLVLEFNLGLSDGSMLGVEDSGDITELTIYQPDNISEDLLYSIIPSGVSLEFLSYFYVNGEQLVLSDGNYLVVS